ncbi:hypothetical protein Hanom_Chr09g00800021 [Helianthus anomalus]
MINLKTKLKCNAVQERHGTCSACLEKDENLKSRNIEFTKIENVFKEKSKEMFEIEKFFKQKEEELTQKCDDLEKKIKTKVFSRFQ